MAVRILHLDIETSPNVCYTWGLHNENIGVDQIISPSALLCFSAKWHQEPEIMFYSTRKDGANNMVKAAYKLMNEADIICHYNGLRFDIPILNQAFLRLRLRPPAPSVQIDLCQIVQHRFRMTSSKLAFVGPYLKIGEKVKHQGFDLWTGCLNGDQDCWNTMEKYNKEDTALVEKLYLRILPWIPNHPNVCMYKPDGRDPEHRGCPTCGSQRLRSDGFRRATTYTYRRLSCLDCGAWCRERLSMKSEPKPPVRSL